MTFLSALSAWVAVLDSDRRIVWTSLEFQNFVNAPGPLALLGKRPGEALGCVHSLTSSRGCGSVQACYLCGAVDAILESRRQDQKVTRTGALEVDGPGGRRCLELEITSAPWLFDNRLFTVLTFR